MDEMQMIRVLEARGYVVRDGRESQRPLTWNRLEPFPRGLDFKAEAVEKIREMITEELLTFTTRQVHSTTPGEMQTVHTAALRVL